MPALASLRSLWRHTIRRADMEQNMSAELEFHLAARADDLMARRGLSASEARRIARLEFGSVEKFKEETRRSLGLGLVDDLRGDLRFALRTFVKHKIFAIATVATLALGIGATTAIFSVMDAVVFRALPVEEPEALLRMQIQRQGRPVAGSFTNPLWEAIRDQQDVFSSLFAWSTPSEFSFEAGGSARPVQTLIVSGEFFGTLGVTPRLGRLLAAADDRGGCAPLAVLSEGFWQSQFGGSPDAVGSAVTLNRQRFEVVGVTPARFYGVNVGKGFDVAIPLCVSAMFDPQNLASRGRWWLSIMGRMKSGLTEDRVQSRFTMLSRHIMAAALPAGTPAAQQEFLTRTLTTSPGGAGASELRATFREPLNVLMVIVALVLLIGCANIASLMLARVATREKEMATRKALGASRGRLVRQLLAESALLCVAGAAFGLALARWGAPLLVRTLSTSNDRLYLDLSLDRRVLGFTVAVTILTTLLVGLLPALRSSRATLIESMKARSASSGHDRSRFRAGKWIVAGQVALSLVLLIGGGLLLRTFVTLITLDLGFDRRNVLVVSARPPRIGAGSTEPPVAVRNAQFDDITHRLPAIPGVVSVARSFTTPIGEDNWMNDITSDAPNTPTGDQALVYFNYVAPGYFATLRTPMVSGRDFTEQDTPMSARVAIVNQTLAERFFPGLNPIGRTFRQAGNPVPIEVVGVVRDAKYGGVREGAEATAFEPATQMPLGRIATEFELRTVVPPSTLIAAVRQTAAQVNGDIALTFHTLETQVADNLVQERLMATLAGFFAVLALLLAAIGLYGVLSYLVERRQAEFGIRMALGAQPGSVLRLVMRDVLVVLGCGLAAGLVAALLAVRLLEGLLFGLAPRDPMTILTAIGLLSAMALLGGYLPARRATRVHPTTALRAE